MILSFINTLFDDVYNETYDDTYDIYDVVIKSLIVELLMQDS